MTKAVVTRSFMSKGKTFVEGTIVLLPTESLDALAGLVEVIPDSPMQQQSSDWRWFCDSHERTLLGQCPVKHSRDPFTDCVGWKLKNGQTLH